jgi:hypothetical protein
MEACEVHRELFYQLRRDGNGAIVSVPGVDTVYIRTLLQEFIQKGGTGLDPGTEGGFRSELNGARALGYRHDIFDPYARCANQQRIGY